MAVGDPRAPYLQPQHAGRDEVASLQLLHAGGVVQLELRCGITALAGQLGDTTSTTTVTEHP